MRVEHGICGTERKNVVLQVNGVEKNSANKLYWCPQYQVLN